MNIGQSVADLGCFGLRRRAFTADELRELLGSPVDAEALESTLSADPNVMSFGADQQGQNWYALKSDLFGWFCHLNSRLARAVVFQLQDEELGPAMSSLRTEGRWRIPPQGAVAWGESLGLIGRGVRSGHYVFPLARLLSCMSPSTLRAAKAALRQLSDNHVWEMRGQRMTGQYFRDGFFSCDPRTRAVVLRRTGLETGKKMTLEEAGSPWGLTRERTRQLEQSFWSRLKANAGVGRHRRQALVTAMLCDFFAHRGSLAIRIGSGTQHLRAFLARCSMVPAAKLSELGFLVLTASAEDLGPLLSQDYFPSQLTPQAIAKKLESEGLAGLIARDTRALAEAAGHDRHTRLTMSQRVYLALQAIGRPAHYSRIAEAHNSLFRERARAEHNIHACLCREQLGVVWVGARGTYALEEWGYERPTATLFDSVADIVERKYQETGRPVPYSVIVAEIGKLRPIVNLSSLTFATHCNDRLQRLDGSCFLPVGVGESTSDEPTMEELDRILRAFQERPVPRESTEAD